MPRVVGLVLVLSGMLFFALLVGLIGESIEAKIEGLKEGKGRVIEAGHTLVLGWSDKLLPFVKQIAKANESEGGGVIVVLANKSKEEMDKLIASELTAEEMGATRVVCRQGTCTASPTSPTSPASPTSPTSPASPALPASCCQHPKKRHLCRRGWQVTQ